MHSKQHLLENIDPDYLKKVILGINNTPRYDFLDMNHSEFIDYVDRKFTKKQLHTIWGNYFLGISPSINYFFGIMLPAVFIVVWIYFIYISFN